MQKFSMVCSCGDAMSVEAESKEEAVTKLQNMMTQEAIDAHCTEKHPGMMLKKEDVDAEISQKLAAE